MGVQNGDRYIYRVVAREDPPFVMVDRDVSGKVSFTGFAIDLFKKIAVRAKFNYEIHLSDATSYGYQHPNRKWTGLISELQGPQPYDIAIGPLPRSSKQIDNIVDYTKPFMYTPVNLLVNVRNIKSRVQPEHSIALMLEPFKAEVWVMICLAFIAVSLALFLIGSFSPYEWAKCGKDRESKTARKIFDLKNSFFFAATTISLQGYKEAPKSFAGRGLVCMWFMFILSVLLAYASSLTSIIMTRNVSSLQGLPFLTYEDILENKQVKIGAMKNDFVYSSLQSSKLFHEGLMSSLYSYIDMNQDWLQDINEGINRVKRSRGNYTLIMESVKSEYLTLTNCDLMTYGETLFKVWYSFAVRKNLQLLNRIDQAIPYLREAGFLTELQIKYFDEKRICPIQDSKEVVSISSMRIKSKPLTGMDMKDMAIPFLFLFLGILGAGGTLAGEIYYKRKLATKKNSDAKVREPLNPDASNSRAPKTSPPPPPIYKVTNKPPDNADCIKSAKPMCVKTGTIEVVVPISEENDISKEDEIKEENEMEDNGDKIMNEDKESNGTMDNATTVINA